MNKEKKSIKMEPRTPLDLEDYHEMKKSFLAKFSDREAWGNQISSKRLRAIDDVVDFITKTELNPEVIEEELRARIEAENEEVLLGNLNITEEDRDFKEKFNKWFEKEIKEKGEKPEAKLFEESYGHFSFPHGRKVHVFERDDEEYKQQPSNPNSDFSQQNQFSNNNPDVVLYLQALFMLMVAVVKAFNDHLSNFSNSSLPMMILHPANHSQFSMPMPMHATKPMRSPVVVKSRDTESKCYCSKVKTAISDVTSKATSGVMMGTKWARVRVLYLKEKVKLTFIGLVIGEKWKSIYIEETRNVKT